MGSVPAKYLGGVFGLWPEIESKKIASGGDWGYIGQWPRGKMEIQVRVRYMQNNEALRIVSVRKRIAEFVSKNDFPFNKKKAEKLMFDRFEGKRAEQLSEGKDFEADVSDNLMTVYKQLRNSSDWKKD